MLRKVIFLTFLISFSLSDKNNYLPMEKDSKYGEDVCRYRDDDGYYHVKACEKGKYCADISLPSTYTYLEICQDLPNVTKPFNLNEGKCQTSFECELGLACLSNCVNYCASGEFYSDYRNDCTDNSLKKTGEICYEKTYDTSNMPQYRYSEPVKNKKCGKLTLGEVPGTTNRGLYEIKLIEYAYLGSVEDGGYVQDMDLCQSGYALYFYYDGLFDDPSTSSGNRYYLKCITPISIIKSQAGFCSVRYKLDGQEFTYNINGLGDSSKQTDLSNAFCSEKYIKIKSEKYREFYANITEEERNTCGDLDSSNQYTCENKELIKTWFFYKYQEAYILYNEREKLDKVLEYEIQKKYPTYYANSQFLNIQILLFLLLLF